MLEVAQPKGSELSHPCHLPPLGVPVCVLNQGYSRLGIQGLSLDLLTCWIQTGNQAKYKHPTQQESVLTLKIITVLLLRPWTFTPSLSSYRRVTHCYVRTKRRSQACPCSQHLEAPWTDMPLAGKGKG